MKKLAISLSALAVAALGGCYMYEPDRPAMALATGNVAPQPVPYYTGMGTIAKITTSPSYATTAAAAGASTNTVRPGYPFNRLVIRMDSGATQYVDTDSNEFRSGMRVELLPDRTIRPLQPVATIQAPAGGTAPASRAPIVAPAPVPPK